MLSNDFMELIFWICINAALISVAIKNFVAINATKKNNKSVRRLMRIIEKYFAEANKMLPIANRLASSSEEMMNVLFSVIKAEIKKDSDHEMIDLKFPNDEK